MSGDEAERDDLTQKVEVKHMDQPRKRQADCLVLIHTEGPDLGKRFDLKGNNIGIGRDPESDIFLDEETVSRKHARIEKGSGQTVVIDLGSTNGTYINDERVMPFTSTPLKEGDRLKFGRTIFKYLAGNVIETLYYEEIHKMAIMDGLTGLFNKRYFMENLDKEISRARRHQRPLSMIIFDIDHFKLVNDTHGHLAGDHVLKSLSELIKSRVRREELVARYGGEELVVLMPETDVDGATQLADQVRQRVESHEFAFSSQKIAITVSGGVAGADEANYEVMPFIQIADERLYEAKNAGRNQVVGRD